MEVHKKLTLELNRSTAYETLEAHRGDKNSRYIDCTITNDGIVLTLTDTMAAVYDATIDGLVVADGEEAEVDTENNIIVVELTENMLSVPGILKIDLKISEDASLITTQTFRIKVADSVINEESKFEPTKGTTAQRLTALETNAAETEAALSTKADADTAATKNEVDALLADKANVTDVNTALAAKQDTLVYDDAPAAGHMTQVLSSHAVLMALANKADKKTTLKGYGITDAYTKTESDALLADKANVADVNTALAKKQDTLVYDDAPAAGHMSQVLSSHAILMALANKADKKTTLKGYGITDAYTKTESDALLAEKAGMDAYENVVRLADISSAEQLNDYTDINKTYIFNLVQPMASNLGISIGTECVLNNYTNSQVLRVVRANKLFLRSYSGTWSNFSDFTIPDSYITKAKLSADVLNEFEDIKACIGYTDSDILGLQVDFENKTFTRLAGAVGLSAGADFDRFTMYGGRKRCNVSDDGTITAYYGDENYAEDGSNGQVMVYQPKFYYKVAPLKLESIAGGIGCHQRKTNFYISATPKAGFKLHPAFYDENGNEVDYILFSAYEGSMYDVSAAEYVNDGTNTDTAIETGDLLCSVAGVKPISGLYKKLTKAKLELMAQNRNSGWHLETIKATSANQLLMMIELGTMDTQTAIGQGIVSITDNTSYSCSSLTGSTAALGNGTGQAVETINEIGGTQTAYTESGKVSVSYRGIENPWGNNWKHINGINIWGNGTMLGGQLYIADDFNFSESKNTDNYKPVGFTLPNESGYIKAIGYGGENYDWLFMPSEIGGTSAFPVGDYCFTFPNLNGYRIAVFGNRWNQTSSAGGFCWGFSEGGSHYARAIGGRLVYIPTAKI